MGQELLGRGPLVRILLQCQGNHRPNILTTSLRQRRRFCANDLDQGGRHIAGLEGMPQGQDLVEYRAQGPDVNPTPIRHSVADLWCQVCRRPDHGPSSQGLIHDLRNTEVAQLGVPRLHEKNVLRLDVPVQNPLLVDVSQGRQALAKQGHGLVLLKVLPRRLPPVHLRVEITPVRVLQDDVQLICLDEGVVVGDDVRVEQPV
mmetsp:Transcript_25512/g.59277  ORF Transcript_25512/g.59277 Transcript_25512/m.59277 type:complete len:202 (-) Transcript_25512:695-1300(-)